MQPYRIQTKITSTPTLRRQNDLTTTRIEGLMLWPYEPNLLIDAGIQTRISIITVQTQTSVCPQKKEKCSMSCLADKKITSLAVDRCFGNLARRL